LAKQDEPWRDGYDAGKREDRLVSKESSDHVSREITARHLDDPAPGRHLLHARNEAQRAKSDGRELVAGSQDAGGRAEAAYQHDSEDVARLARSLLVPGETQCLVHRHEHGAPREKAGGIRADGGKCHEQDEREPRALDVDPRGAQPEVAHDESDQDDEAETTIDGMQESVRDHREVKRMQISLAAVGDHAPDVEWFVHRARPKKLFGQEIVK
jgi:hypothetical protein